MKLTPLVTPAIEVDYLTLEKVVRALFHYRRKMIRNSARCSQRYYFMAICSESSIPYRLMFPDHPELVGDLFRMSDVDNTLRAQDLSLKQFEAICCSYVHLLKLHCPPDTSQDRAPEQNL